ncbi:MAG: GTP 3',8-cyclase MoaA [Pseudomonadales bacterium]
MNTEIKRELIDSFKRRVSYVRLSVTDRCDFRCVYCMAEDMQFLPRAQILSLEEIARLAQAFVGLGVSKIRLTGGEPLVRKNILWLVETIAALDDLRELALTTNGSQLPKLAPQLKQAGLTRVNISLDSLQPDRFHRITRTGDLESVLHGIDAAQSAGFKHTKINSVILNGRNEDEIIDLVEFCRTRELDISFIEEMPLGLIDDHDRALTYCSSDQVRETIEQRYALTHSEDSTGGPSRYYKMPDSTIRVGFISPHSHNFCADCNRVRVTVEGRLLLCLGNEHSVDLKNVLRAEPSSQAELERAIVDAMQLKPEKHYFDLQQEPQILRFMNMTGG